MIMKSNKTKKHIVIVGGSGGIGYKLTKKLTSNNRLTIVTRKKEKFLNIKNKDINVVKFDVLDFSKISNLLENIIKDNGKIDSLIYCVGVQIVKPLRNFTIKEIKKIIDTNLISAMIFGKEMSSNRISDVNATFCAISSIAATEPEAAIIPYSVSKAGLETMIKGLSLENPTRKFIGVAPGWLNTEMTQSFSHIYDKKFKKKLQKKSPLGITTIDGVVGFIVKLILKKIKCANGKTIKLNKRLSK